MSATLDGGGLIGTQARSLECSLQISDVRRFALAEIGYRLRSEPTLVAAFWEEIGAPVDPARADLTVLFCTLRCSGQTFELLEFVSGETLEELVKRSDPSSCEWEIPLFCRLLDAFEGASRNESNPPVPQPHLELIDFGVGRAATSTKTRLHGGILIGPEGASSEQIFGEYGASRSHVCALLMEMCTRLPGNLPRSSAYGPANLGECAVRSLASKILPSKPVPPVAASPIKSRLLDRTLASTFVIALATAALVLSMLYGIGGFLARRSITAETGKLFLAPVKAVPLEIPLEVSPPMAPTPEPTTAITIRPPVRKPAVPQPVPSIVLARGARPIRQTSLEYPAVARKEHISGTVEMQLTIAEDGSVQSPRMLSGDPLLQAGLAEEISKWVYQPLRVNGKPVPMTTELSIRFKLNP
jgi:TonB family protein